MASAAATSQGGPGEGSAGSAPADLSLPAQTGQAGAASAAQGSSATSVSGPAGSTGGVGPSSATAPSGPGQVGVTARTINLGFIDVVNNNQLEASFGVKGADFGNSRAQADAVVTDLNARGGILGRKVVAVFATYDSVSQDSDDVQYARICSQLTQDHHVFAVLAPWNTTTGFATCLAKAHVLYLTDGLLQEDAQTFSQLAPYLISGLFSVSHGAVALASGLYQQGFFAPASKVGIVRFDYPAFQRVSDNYLRPTLASYGVRPVAEAAVRRDFDIGAHGRHQQCGAAIQGARCRPRRVPHRRGRDRPVLHGAG